MPDHAPTRLQTLEPLQEVGALFLHARLEIRLGYHPEDFQGDCSPQRVRRKRRVCRAGWEFVWRNQLLSRPKARERIEAVRERLAEDNNVGRNTEVLER